jgi:hypothetical protein
LAHAFARQLEFRRASQGSPSMHSATAKRLLWTLALLSLLLGAYALWPIYGFYQIATAIERRDAAQLDKLVDYRELRRTLTNQIVEGYFKKTGKRGGLNSHLAASLGSAFADPMVEQFLNSNTLLALLGPGSAPASLPGTGSAIAANPLGGNLFENPWQLFRNSEYSGQLFYVTVPLNAPPERQFRLRLRLIQWQWKLAGVGLPEAIVAKIVAEIEKATKR